MIGKKKKNKKPKIIKTYLDPHKMRWDACVTQIRLKLILDPSGGARISIQGGQDQKSILKKKKSILTKKKILTKNNNNYKCHTKTNYT